MVSWIPQKLGIHLIPEQPWNPLENWFPWLLGFLGNLEIPNTETKSISILITPPLDLLFLVIHPQPQPQLSISDPCSCTLNLSSVINLSYTLLFMTRFDDLELQDLPKYRDKLQGQHNT